MTLIKDELVARDVYKVIMKYSFNAFEDDLNFAVYMDTKLGSRWEWVGKHCCLDLSVMFLNGAC